MSMLITRRNFIKGVAAGSCLLGLEGFDTIGTCEELEKEPSNDIHIVDMDDLSCLVGVGDLGGRVCSQVAGMKRRYGKPKPEWLVEHISGYPDSDLGVLENCVRGKSWVWVVGSGYVSRFWSARSLTLSSALREEFGCLVCTVLPEEWDHTDEDTRSTGFRGIGVPREKECWISLQKSCFAENASRLIMDIYGSLAFLGPVCLDFMDLEAIASNTMGRALFFTLPSIDDLTPLKHLVSVHSSALRNSSGMFVVFSHADSSSVDFMKLEEAATILVARTNSNAAVNWGAISKTTPANSLSGTILLTRSNGNSRQKSTKELPDGWKFIPLEGDKG